MRHTIKDIRISELQAFIDSKEYKAFKNSPISYHRAVSYINNPRAKKDDIAVSLLYKEGELIAYRCLYSDYFFHQNKKVGFAWISGSWVHPKYRRQGYSMKLLEHCIQQRKEGLMFSNYAPESKTLYDKSGYFQEVANLEGRRFYFRFSFAELLPPKNNFFKVIKPLLLFVDFYLNILFDVRFIFYRNKAKRIYYERTKNIDEEVHLFIEKHNKLNPFKRNSKAINHAQNYSWVIEKNAPDDQDKRYYFSSNAKQFKYKNIKVYDNEGTLAAFLLLKIRNRSMAIPYTFFNQKELSTIVEIILGFVKKYKVNYLCVYNSLLADELLKQKKLILFSKKMHKKFFASKKIERLFDKKVSFFAGDGDNLYT